jgi:hypothetical protein
MKTDDYYNGSESMEAISEEPSGTCMVVGVGLIRLMVHDSNSLKSKRKVIKSILGRVRSKFDVSIAEVDYQDKWQLGSIGFSVVSNDASHAHKMLESIMTHVEGLYLAEIVDSRIEILHY